MTLILFTVVGALFLLQLAAALPVPSWVYVALTGLYGLGRFCLRGTRWWFEFGRDP